MSMNSPAASRRRARGFSGCSGANLQKSTNRHKLITPAQLPVAPQLKVAARDQNAPHRPISLLALPYRGQLNWTDELGSPSDGLITPPSCQIHVNSCCIGTRTRQLARVETQPLPNRAVSGSNPRQIARRLGKAARQRASKHSIAVRFRKIGHNTQLVR